MEIGFHQPHLRFLSNFHPCDLITEYGVFSSAEHLYQAMKCESANDRETIRLTSGPAAAKKLARRMPVRSDWDDIKVDVMKWIIQMKFRPGTFLAQLLMETDDKDLIEFNYWHDSFWGVCTCGRCPKGKNWLGELLREWKAFLQLINA